MNIQQIERQVLGALLINSVIKDDVFSVLQAGVFQIPEHREVFTAMQTLYDHNFPIDVITVFDNLKKTDLTAGDVTSLTQGVATGNDAPTHARILVEQWMRRELKVLSQEFILMAEDPQIDVFDLVNECQTKMMTLGQHIQVGTIQHIKNVVDRVHERSLKAKENPGTLLGLSSGFTDLDKLVNGWKEPDLVILAARPAMGKTAMALNMAKNANSTVGLFSLEMSAAQLATRLLSMSSGIETGSIEKGEYITIDHHVKQVKGYDIYINDTAGISTRDLRVSARKMVNELGCKMIMVDYIQLMHSRKRHQSREQEVSQISQSLKNLAKDLKVPVIALSQLSRAVENRSDKRPMLSDLRESGAIEQDADLVMFLYRDNYYDAEADPYLAELIIAKHRNGGTGTIRLNWESKTTNFGDYVTQNTESYF